MAKKESVWEPTYRHKARGTEYVIVGEATLYCTNKLEDYSEVVVFEEADGSIHVREVNLEASLIKCNKIILGSGRLQLPEPFVGTKIVIVYRDQQTIWVRGKEEFFDGRFVKIS